MDKLKIDSIKIGYIFFALCIIFGCSKEKKINPQNDLLSEYKDLFFHKYKNLYIITYDSVNSWVVDSLSVTKSIFFKNGDWQIDSVFLFNADSNRFFTTINKRTSNYKDATMDGIQEFGGAKINGKWYFFFIASTMAVPREFYKEDKYEPLTFEELSYISHNEIMKGFIIRKEDESFVSNEEKFKQKFFDAWGTGCEGCTKVSDFDSMILVTLKEKYRYKLDKKEIEEIKREMANSKRPIEQKKWWQFW